MKPKLTSLVVAALAAVLLAPAASAETNNKPALLSASQLKGAEVKNLQNQEVGDIDEVLIDPASGRIRFVVLSVGGFLGLGDTNVAVPWDALRVTKEGETTKYVIDATKERLEKAPRVEGKRYDRLYSRQDAEPTFVYWGITWYDMGPSASPSPGASAKPSASPTPAKK